MILCKFMFAFGFSVALTVYLWNHREAQDSISIVVGLLPCFPVQVMMMLQFQGKIFLGTCCSTLWDPVHSVTCLFTVDLEWAIGSLLTVLSQLRAGSAFPCVLLMHNRKVMVEPTSWYGARQGLPCKCSVRASGFACATLIHVLGWVLSAFWTFLPLCICWQCPCWKQKLSKHGSAHLWS